MPISNFIMAIILALFFLVYLKALADIAKKLTPEKQGLLVTSQIIKHIFYGIVLCVLLTLLGITTFTFSDIFICVCLVILIQTIT